VNKSSTIHKYKGLLFADFKDPQICSGFDSFKRICMPHAEQNEFYKIIKNIKSNTPTMVELGSHCCMWSLLFRQKFPHGRNITVELKKPLYEWGKNNFRLNGYNCSSHWGGLFIEPNLKKFGPELNLKQILKNECLTSIDLLHMDIQGSEDKVILDLKKDYLDTGIIKNLIIATHSQHKHNTISKQLALSSKFNINCSYVWPAVDFNKLLTSKEKQGGDGFLTFSLKKF